MLQSTQQILGKLPRQNPFTATAEEIAAANAADERRAWQQRIDKAGIPERFRGARIDDCCTNVHLWFRDYQRGKPSWLNLAGTNGTGKTYQACACLHEAARTNQVYFVTMEDLMTKLQDTFGTRQSTESVLYRYTNTSLLVVDELEKFKATDWTANKMFSLFNTRYAKNKATIITTNLNPSKLFTALSKAAGEELAASLLSRLMDKQNTTVVFTEADRRLA